MRARRHRSSGRHARPRLGRAIVLAASLALGTVGAINQAAAQSSTMSTVYFSAGSRQGPQITRSDMDVFIRVLVLGDVESRTLLDLYEAYATEWSAGYRAMRSEAADHIERAEILQNQDLLSRIWPLQQKWNEEAKKLESRFLDDVTTMLTREQEQRWPIVERELRRIKTMGQGRLAGESVDIVRLVESMVPGEHITEDAAELLEQYARDLDAALLRRQRFLEEHEKGYDELVSADPDRAEEIYFRAIRIRAGVCAVNERYARLIAATMPTEIAERLDAAFREQSYSMYIKPTRIERQILAAEELSGLTEPQREHIRSLVSSYRAAFSTLNEREIEIRLRQEREEVPGFILKARDGNDDNSWRMLGWGEDHPLTRIRHERLELDRRYRDRLRTVLSDDQYGLLPDTVEGGVFFYGYGHEYPSL